MELLKWNDLYVGKCNTRSAPVLRIFPLDHNSEDYPAVVRFFQVYVVLGFKNKSRAVIVTKKIKFSRWFTNICQIFPLCTKGLKRIVVSSKKKILKRSVIRNKMWGGGTNNFCLWSGYCLEICKALSLILHDFDIVLHVLCSSLY